MRTIFLLLLLANLAFFAWAHYLAQPDAGSDAQPLARQIDPQKLPIVSPAPARASAVAAAPAAVAAADCVEWGSFTLTDLPAARKLLEPLALGARLSEQQVEETANWWVYIPPQGDRQGAQRKGAELKALGIDDFFVLQDEGSFQWAISLGVFRSEAAAQARLAALKEKGVRSAQVGARVSQVPKVWLRVRDTDPVLRARLRAVAQSIDGSELRDCK
ncbi:MAG TPA: SPOR domain-containing protein [Burkholderiales bacterium]|nr:SPOR domain-containing protein [Burkholderiales bacterium]